MGLFQAFLYSTHYGPGAKTPLGRPWMNWARWAPHPLGLCHKNGTPFLRSKDLLLQPASGWAESMKNPKRPPCMKFQVGLF